MILKKASSPIAFLLCAIVCYPSEYKTQTDLIYREEAEAKADKYIAERCRLDLYYPADKKGFPTVVWFHGGGLRSGKKSIPKQLKEQGIAVVAANYRLFPQVKCPAYIEDAAAAVAWTFQNITKYGGDPKHIYLAGHSAGGYLTSMVGLDKTYLAKHGVDANQIAGLHPLSGHTITHFTPRQERGIAKEKPLIDEYAPLYHVRPDAPPIVLTTGDRDLELLGRYEENAYFWRMMKVAGHKASEIHEFKGRYHGTMTSPAFRLLLDRIQNSTK